ncbi:Extracellular ligand-binding receptor precursor [Minicystis rosea]|nr:Extracellular ligand-binding receptor precursor [Minicystis rosea]
MIPARHRAALFGAATIAVAAATGARVVDRPTDGVRAESAACASSDAAVARGRRIFRKGETRRGPLEAVLDRGETTLSGRDAACAGCHGPTGAGNEEGAITVPSLRPERLFSAPGRYDDRSLGAALREGRAADRRLLRMPMPRYRIDDADLADLTAYLRCLGHDRDPGVGDDAVRVGAALPLSGPIAALGTAARDALAASFADINRRGGVFRRRIDLVVEDSGARDGEGAEERLVARGVLALVGSLVREDPERAARLEAAEIPLVLPLVAAPERPPAHAFYLYPSDDVLARVAVTHLARRGVDARLLVVHEQGPQGELSLARAREEARVRGMPAPAALSVEPGRLEAAKLLDVVRSAPADAILFVGAPTNFAAVVAAAEKLPGLTLYAPAAALAGGATIPTALRERVLFVRAALPRTALAEGASQLAAVLRQHGVAERHLPFQIGAAVAARVLEEGLRRAGDPPTRDGLMTSLESLRDFETGLSPPLSFGRNRHVGVLGAHVLRLDEVQGAPARAPTWIGLVP